MRAFLSSYRFGNGADTLLELLGDCDQVGIIANAKDYKTADERAESLADLYESFKEIGIEPAEIDLRQYFDDSSGLREELEEYEFIWLAGGNTFILARALKQSGADNLIRTMVQRNELIYGGESAGAIMATPTLRGAEFGDEPDLVPPGYQEDTIWEGLGLVPFAIVPHYESDWEGYERMIEILEEEDIPYQTLTDSQALRVVGDDRQLAS